MVSNKLNKTRILFSIFVSLIHAATQISLYPLDADVWQKQNENPAHLFGGGEMKFTERPSVNFTPPINNQK